MGSTLSFVNDSNVRCNIKVYTVGRSFVVIHSNLLPGEKSKHDIHKVWYDIIYEFDDGRIYEDGGVYLGDDVHVKISKVLVNLEQQTRQATENDERLLSESKTEAVESTLVSCHAPSEDGGEAYPKLALEADFTCTPAALFKLMYKDEEFMAQVREEEAGVTDINIGEWTSIDQDSEGVEKRELSFIMPLSHSVGPAQTSCNIVETVEHYDEDAYIAVHALTRTPDVPYGQSFATMTRTCFTWNKRGGTKMTVTVKMKWEKSTMLKGVIESQANEGQMKHQHVLAKRIGEWISSHPDDFPVEIAPEEPQPSPSTKSGSSKSGSIHTNGELPIPPTEGTPLLEDDKVSLDSTSAISISRPPIPTPMTAILAISNVATFGLLVWSLTRSCAC